MCIDTEAVIWAKKAHCVVPIRDCGLALDAVTPRVVHLSYRPSRTLLPPIPQMACMLVLHHVSDLVFKDAAGIVKGVSMEITGPVVDRGTKAQAGEAADDAIVTAVNVALTKDGTVDILFDGSAIFACKIGSVAGVGLGADAAEPGHPRWAPRLDGRPERATECVSDRVHGPSNGHDASEELLGALEASCALWAALTDVTTHSGRPGCLSRLDVAGCIRVDTDLAVNRHLVLCRNASGDPAAPAEVVCGAVRSRLAHTPPSANAANFYDVRSTRLQLPVADQVDRRVLFLHQNERAAVDPARLLDAAPASCAWTHVRWNKAGEGSGPNRALQGDIFISSMTQLLVICESSAVTECLSVVGTGVGIVGDGGPAFAAAGSDRRTSSPFGSPYGSSPVEFFAAFALADMNIKRGVVIAPGAADADAALYEGVSMANMLEHDRRRYIPTIRLREEAIPAGIFFSALDMDTEFAVDVWRDRAAADRLVAGQAEATVRSKPSSSSSSSSSSSLSTSSSSSFPACLPFENSIIISGGTRGLGRVVAAQLARRNVTLVLTSVSGQVDEAFLLDIKRRTHKTVVKQCDWSDESAVAKLLAWARESLPVVSLIVHAAGTPG